MLGIDVTVEGDLVVLKSPYNDECIKRIKALGGRWNPRRRVWEVNSRYEDNVREIAMDIYGTDGRKVETTTIRIDLDKYGGTLYDEIVIAGQTVVKKRHRDQLPVLVRTAVVKGKLLSSGGSLRYPLIKWKAGTILEVWDVPLSIASKLANENDGITIVR